MSSIKLPYFAGGGGGAPVTMPQHVILRDHAENKFGVDNTASYFPAALELTPQQMNALYWRVQEWKVCDGLEMQATYHTHRWALQDPQEAGWIRVEGGNYTTTTTTATTDAYDVGGLQDAGPPANYRYRMKAKGPVDNPLPIIEPTKELLLIATPVGRRITGRDWTKSVSNYGRKMYDIFYERYPGGQNFFGRLGGQQTSTLPNTSAAQVYIEFQWDFALASGMEMAAAPLKEFVVYNPEKRKFTPFITVRLGHRVPTEQGGDVWDVIFQSQDRNDATNPASPVLKPPVGVATFDPVVAPPFDVPIYLTSTTVPQSFSGPPYYVSEPGVDIISGTIAGLKFEATKFFQYQNRAGQPVYDTETGAQLNDPFS